MNLFNLLLDVKNFGERGGIFKRNPSKLKLNEKMVVKFMGKERAIIDKIESSDQ